MTGGGSGGHITPLLSLAHELKRQNKNCKLIYIGLKGEKTYSFKDEYRIFDRVFYISSGKLRRYHGESHITRLLDIKRWVLNFIDLFKITAGFFSAYKILKDVKPGAVFSKGGFVVVPVGLAARLQKIAIITHDSDAVPGLANRILGKWASVRTSGVPGVNSAGKQPVYVGIPIDPRIKYVSPLLQKQYKQEIGAGETEQVLVVSGGGLGARDLNKLIVSSSLELLHSHPDLRIYHIAGSKHEEAVRHDYEKMLEPSQERRVKVIGFTTEFYKYTGASDLIVSRAGATTIAEVAIQAKPVVLIPAPFLTGGHQLENAQALHKLGAVKVADNSITADKFTKIISDLLNNRDKCDQMAKNLASAAKPDAAASLATLLLNTVQEKTLSSKD